MTKTFFAPIAAFLLVFLCVPAGAASDVWQAVDSGKKFTFQIPPDMKEVAVQGTDSYVRQFEGPAMEMSFDYGVYSDPLNYSTRPEYAEEQLTIGGRLAKLVTFYNPGTNMKYEYVMAVHFSDLGIKLEGFGKVVLTLWVNCETSQEYPAAERIIKSIRFPEK